MPDELWMKGKAVAGAGTNKHVGRLTPRAVTRCQYYRWLNLHGCPAEHLLSELDTYALEVFSAWLCFTCPVLCPSPWATGELTASHCRCVVVITWSHLRDCCCA
jgi:hypothetical protein